MDHFDRPLLVGFAEWPGCLGESWASHLVDQLPDQAWALAAARIAAALAEKTVALVACHAETAHIRPAEEEEAAGDGVAAVAAASSEAEQSAEAGIVAVVVVAAAAVGTVAVDRMAAVVVAGTAVSPLE